MTNNERGFTLVEAIVAMMICTVGLMSLAQLMAVSLRMQQLGRNSTSAARLAQDKVDELTTIPFDPTAANYSAQIACGGSLTADSANHFDTPAAAPNYKRRWVISAGPDGTTSISGIPAHLRQVTVRVIPDVNDRRITQPFELTTLLRGTVGAQCP